MVAEIFATDKQKNVLQYNRSRIEYLQWKYTQSLKSLSGSLAHGKYFEGLHNEGNIYYRLGEQAKNPEETTSLWKLALESYSGALQVKEDIETRANYDFVKEKLKQNEETSKSQKESNEAKDDSQQAWKSGSWTETNSGKTQEWDKQWSQSNAAGTWSNQWNFNNVGSGSDAKWLSEDQKKQLEQYLQDMKKNEKEYRQFFNTTPSPSQNGISDMIKNFFWDDPFFSNNIGGEQKKDW